MFGIAPRVWQSTKASTKPLRTAVSEMTKEAPLVGVEPDCQAVSGEAHTHGTDAERDASSEWRTWPERDRDGGRSADRLDQKLRLEQHSAVSERDRAELDVARLEAAAARSVAQHRSGQHSQARGGGATQVNEGEEGEEEGAEYRERQGTAVRRCAHRWLP